MIALAGKNRSAAPLHGLRDADRRRCAEGVTLVIVANSHLEMKPILIILTPLLLAPLATLNAVEPITNSIGMKLVPIAPGRFQMGQDGPQTDYDMRKHPGESDRADWDEKPVHQVKISKPFHIGATEVTVEQIRQFDPEYRKRKGLPDEAASGISWHKAVGFCQWLSKKEGRTYRLPRDGDHTIYHLANGHSENIVRTSTDNGATWSRARPIYPQGETGSGMIRTREGSLIITQDVGVSLHRSNDNGKSWTSVGGRRPDDDVRPGGKGGRHAGIHAPVVEPADGRLMRWAHPAPHQPEPLRLQPRVDQIPATCAEEVNAKR